MVLFINLWVIEYKLKLLNTGKWGNGFSLFGLLMSSFALWSTRSINPRNIIMKQNIWIIPLSKLWTINDYSYLLNLLWEVVTVKQRLENSCWKDNVVLVRIVEGIHNCWFGCPSNGEELLITFDASLFCGILIYKNWFQKGIRYIIDYRYLIIDYFLLKMF